VHLLKEWKTSPGLFLVDPYIHIWRGYDDPDNLSDKEHQLIYEDLRNRLAPYDGRHVFARDFSYSFAKKFAQDPTSPAPAFVYVDANHAHEAVTKDLESWWPLVGQGGVIAGGTYINRAGQKVFVKKAVDDFADKHQLKVYITTDDDVPSWYIIKRDVQTPILA